MWMFACTTERPAGVCRARLLHFAGITLFAFLCAACAAPTLPEGGPQAPAPLDGYTLGPGDRIRITVFGHEDLSGEFVISETGAVSLPLAGTLSFGGATAAEAELSVVEALKPDYLLDPQVSILIVEYRPFYIIGEVNNPGSYPYVNGMTVNEAVALAGGFTYRARTNQVAVIRATDPSRTERTIPVTGMLRPGDIVKVSERFF